LTCYHHTDSVYSLFVTKMYTNDVISNYKLSSPKYTVNDNIALLFINLYLKKIRSLTHHNICRQFVSNENDEPIETQTVFRNKFGSRQGNNNFSSGLLMVQTLRDPDYSWVKNNFHVHHGDSTTCLGNILGSLTHKLELNFEIILLGVFNLKT